MEDKWFYPGEALESTSSGNSYREYKLSEVLSRHGFSLCYIHVFCFEVSRSRYYEMLVQAKSEYSKEALFELAPINSLGTVLPTDRGVTSCYTDLLIRYYFDNDGELVDFRWSGIFIDNEQFFVFGDCVERCSYNRGFIGESGILCFGTLAPNRFEWAVPPEKSCFGSALLYYSGSEPLQ